MTWVIDNSKQTGLGFVTLLMIANHANAEGRQAFPSMKTLARECRSSLRSVQRVILKLEKSGELQVHRSGGRISHSYSLPLMPNVDTESTLPRRQRRHQVSTLQHGHPDHVKSQRGQIDPSNVDIGGLNVDIAMSTDPLEPSGNNKIPSPHGRLMEFLSLRNGGIANPGKEGKDAKLLLETYTPEQAEGCFDFLNAQKWRETAVTWGTVRGQIGNYLKKHSNGSSQILSDNGDEYTVPGDDGTPSKRWRTPEAFAAATGKPLEEVKAKWN